MKREILTPERCREELLWVSRLNWMMVLPVFLCIFCMVLLPLSLICIAEYDWWDENQWDELFPLFILGAIAIGVALLVGIQHRRNQKVRQMVLEIVEDKLVGYLTQEEYSGYGRHRTRYIYYVLSFRYFGDYRIPDRPHYSWSKLYSADRARNVYDRAEIDDTYYIVLNRDAKCKKPLLIYNTKEFVFCPDGTSKSPDSTWRDSVSVE